MRYIWQHIQSIIGACTCPMESQRLKHNWVVLFQGFFLLSIWIGVTSFQNTITISEVTAIKLAEQFIADNGYTLKPAKRKKLSYELWDRYENSTESLLKRRHNSYYDKAFCISENDSTWYIGFLSTSVDLSLLDTVQRQSNLPGRFVEVAKCGSGIELAHKTPLFSRARKL